MEKKKIRIRVAVLLRRGEEVLLVKHRKFGATYWLLPGGGLEYGETIEACARREIREETALEVRIGDLFFVSESIPPDGHRHVVNLYFEGEIVAGELKVGEEEVLAGAEFMPVSRLSQLDLRPPIQRELLDYLQNPDPSRRVSLGNRWDGPRANSKEERPSV